MLRPTIFKNYYAPSGKLCYDTISRQIVNGCHCSGGLWLDRVVIVPHFRPAELVRGMGG